MRSKRTMLLVQISPKFHTDIKTIASKKGQSIKEFVLEILGPAVKKYKDNNFIQ